MTEQTKQFLAGTIQLWPENSPHYVDTENGLPRMVITQPPDRDEPLLPALLICPGGGYHKLAPHEGQPIATLMVEHRMVCAVLTSRVAPHKHPDPITDAARAMRLLRANAVELGIDPNKIAILGFSAGGHLAATLSTQPLLHIDPHDDLKDQYDPRPNRQVLCYPVISMTEEYHKGSANNLLGKDAPENLRWQFSNEQHVDENTPPTFLWHTSDDAAVPVSNSIRYYQACRKYNIPAELHLYETGEHGLGLAPANRVIRTWSDLMIRWFNGWLMPE